MSDTDIHSCGYYCDRPVCIKAQRDELRDKFFKIRTSEENIQNSDNQAAESAQAWVKTYSGGKPNYTQPIKQDDIIRMAREAGFDPHDMSDDFTCNLGDIKRFANLVAAAEREWVGLTNVDLIELVAFTDMSIYDARLVEDKLKEKNNG